MAGIFPEGGVQPNQAYPPGVPADGATDDCEILYYNARCVPRFDPIQANAVIAELLNLVRASPIDYDCSRLDNVALAVQYLIQQSIPNGLFGQGSILPSGTTLYTGSMNPDAIEYVNYMRVTLVPSENNIGPVNINIDGLGTVRVLRNDGQDLKTGDLVQGIPQGLIYWNGSFYLAGVARSQVPLVLDGTVDFWIRTDGSDTTGDGSENTAGKAFRTINGAWAAVGARYVGSPTATIRLRLGIPGEYEGARIRGFGGNVVILGDEADIPSYIIEGDWPLVIDQIGNATVAGVTIKNNYGEPEPRKIFLALGTTPLTLRNVDFIIEQNNPGHEFLVLGGGAILYWSGTVRFIGVGAVRDVAQWVLAYNGAVVTGNENAAQPANLVFENLNMTTATIVLDTLSVFSFGFTNLLETNVTGQEFIVNQNSILRRDGKNVPGNIPGTTPDGSGVIVG